ncbi:nucleoside 2-deoxyribosyltransferase [Bacillus subtilis]|uniref:nucleoside 2-deoxyribosyltransferase n=1 Tax=Bacillus TaxID=1386 RepID=UPI00249B0BD4|nr:nucleoside 2-deoxyribosyltransferase [Bacillus subtilis]CAI6330139.1 Nucleoside 2-deoxyribosyltransferase [Bacillus subtilis]
MKLYLANGLFGIADRNFNDTLAAKIREEIPELEVYLPQENVVVNDKKASATSTQIANADTEHLLSSDILIAVLDGVEIDSGVAAEIGVFSTTGRPILGLYTDVRQLGNDNAKKVLTLVDDITENQFQYRNLYVIGLIKKTNGGIFSTVDDLVVALKKKNDELKQSVEKEVAPQ